MKIQWFLFFLVVFTSCNAQKSKVWADFVDSKKQGKTPILPDFSYAGYAHGEKGIPTITDAAFNVIDYGGIPNDEISDKAAIKKAISAAEKNGGGIIYFPAGRYVINDLNDSLVPILIKKSNIVFRGEKEDTLKTTLFFMSELPAKDTTKLWTTPYALMTKPPKKMRKRLTKIVGHANRESHSVAVKNVSKINIGDWVVVSLLSNDRDLVEKDIAPLAVDEKWTTILNKGVKINEKHQVKAINGNVLTFKEPLHYTIDPKYDWEILEFPHLENIGFENIVFEGNWKKKFVHHKSIEHDGGWSILKLNGVVNSWVRNCVFKNVSRAMTINESAASTVLNISIEGNVGHNAISAGGGSTGILLGKINDTAGMHHTTGVGGGSTSTIVIWRSKHTQNTCFDSHASQTRCTLFDMVEGGFFKGRAGGAIKNLPNHGRYLVLWNYKETDEAEENFDFVAKDSQYWRIVPPIIVGFNGSGTTFNQNEVMYDESHGTPVKPESLFEAQLKLRLGKLPEWIKTEKPNNVE